MLRKLSLGLVMLGVGFGQALPPTPINPPDSYAALKQLIGLTNDQIEKMTQAQVNYSRFEDNKRERVFQVNSEINQETAKPSIDAMALGVRYLELEVICRELREASAAIPKNNLALLTDAQKVKLKLLEDAMNLAPTISQAQALQLLPGSSGGFGLASLLLGGTGGIGFIYNPILFTSSSISLCRATSLIGDFSKQPLDAVAK